MQSVPCFTRPQELEFAAFLNDLYSCGGSAALVPESLALCKQWAKELHVNFVFICCFHINCCHLVLSKQNKCSNLHVIPRITICTQCINSINYPPGLKDDRHSDGALGVDILGHHPAVTIDLLHQPPSISLPHLLYLESKIWICNQGFFNISKKLDNSYFISQANI